MFIFEVFVFIPMQRMRMQTLHPVAYATNTPTPEHGSKFEQQALFCLQQFFHIQQNQFVIVLLVWLAA